MRWSTSAALSMSGSVLSEAMAMAHWVPYSGTYCRYGRTTGNTSRSEATMRASVSGR